MIDVDILTTLLTQGNIVKQSDVAEARGIAKDLSISLAKALIMSGMVAEERINLALQAKSMLENKTISLDLAIRGLRLAVHEKCELESAISKLALVHRPTQQTVSLANDLTALLLESKLISSEQLGEAVMRSLEAKMLIGHTLLLTGIISPRALAAALYGVLMMRQKLLDKEKVCAGLRYANEREITIEHALFELGFFIQPKAETMRLSELMHMAGLLSESALVECLEIELFKNKQFGQVLLEQGLISPPQLESAVELQGAVANAAIKPYQAAVALNRVCKDNINLYQAMAESQAGAASAVDLRLGELLVAAGICQQQSVDDVVDKNEESPIKIGKALMAADVVRAGMLYGSLRCQSLFRHGYFSSAQAIASLAHCQENDVTLDQALFNLGYNAPSRMQWHWA